MDKLLTLEMKLVSNNGRCHILRNVLIENSFELVWCVGVFLSDSVSKLQNREEVTDAESKAHIDVHRVSADCYVDTKQNTSIILRRGIGQDEFFYAVRRLCGAASPLRSHVRVQYEPCRNKDELI